jgi:SAM-dependent methyltransferase
LTHQNCRSCGDKELVEILDLGFAPPSNALLSKKDLSKGEIHYPLVLLFCQECKLVQTRDFHPSEALFTPDYPYLSSTSSTWTKHAYDLVDSLIKEFNLESNSLVAEIASNDGYLLERLAQRNIPAYGIEPTKIAADISIDKGHHVYNCFLNLETASKIKSEKGAADIVIANNVFAHVPELQTFTEAAKKLLRDDGILVIEVQYFGQLLKHNLFDTIYHEHYSYFSATAIRNLLERYQLGIIKLELVSTHGGSIRIYAKNGAISASFENLIAPIVDREAKATNLKDLLKFQKSVSVLKKEIKEFFSIQKSAGNVIAGLGAAAKGNTLINFLRLGRDDIRYVFDSAATKHDKFLPGSHIPIQHLPSLREFSEVNTFVVLPWNIAHELAHEVSNLTTSRPPIYRLMPQIALINY